MMYIFDRGHIIRGFEHNKKIYFFGSQEGIPDITLIIGGLE